MTVVIVAPSQSPLPSHMTHRPPSDRTESVPRCVSGGLSGLIDASISDVHSPTSRWSHWCSLVGSGCIGVPPVGDRRYAMAAAGPGFGDRRAVLILFGRTVTETSRKNPPGCRSCGRPFDATVTADIGTPNRRHYDARDG